MIIVSRETVRFSFKNTDFATISQFYSINENKDKICLFYEKDDLKTLISFYNFRILKKETDFEYYKKNSNNNHIGYEMREAGNIFKRFPFFYYLIRSLNSNNGEFICDIDTNTVTVNDIYLTLNKKGVNVFRINIPRNADLDEEVRADYTCTTYLSHYAHLIMNGDIKAPYYIDKITDISPEKIGICNSVHGKIFGGGGGKKNNLYGWALHSGRLE